MKFCDISRYKEGYCWNCAKCHTYASIFRDSFFAHRCIIPKTFKVILMMWCKDYYVKTLPWIVDNIQSNIDMRTL